jgi:hypothetical protein
MRNKDSIEKKINNFLLKPVTFKLNNKVIKKGKLKIFTIKQFFIKFNLDIDNEIKVFEVPYPYKIHETNNSLAFEYTLSSFCNSNNSELYYKLKTTDKKTSNKMYDSFLYMLTE